MLVPCFLGIVLVVSDKNEVWGKAFLAILSPKIGQVFFFHI
jgi:hypothetical protein